MKVSLVAAIGKNRELGKNNKLLWHIPEDLHRFKMLTTGHPILMGRKTYESIGKPLPLRTNIIITRYANYVVPGCMIVNSLEEGLGLARSVISNEVRDLSPEARDDNNGEIFVIGGGDIFTQILPQADKLYLTIVDATFDADTFFPPYEQLFTKEIKREEGESRDYKYTFLELERG